MKSARFKAGFRVEQALAVLAQALAVTAMLVIAGVVFYVR